MSLRQTFGAGGLIKKELIVFYKKEGECKSFNIPYVGECNITEQYYKNFLIKLGDVKFIELMTILTNSGTFEVVNKFV